MVHDLNGVCPNGVWPEKDHRMTSGRRNVIVGSAVAVVIVGMVGMSFAAIPLYRLFCTATGYGGTPSIGLSTAPGSSGQPIPVRFHADTNPGLPWPFAPYPQ